jgi:hypothetical protein
MNNEPVAWLSEYGDLTRHKDLAEYWEKINWPFTPLYAHPAKTLTDEEIDKVMEEFIHVKYEFNKAPPEFNYLNFAKAILRKANEK